MAKENKMSHNFRYVVVNTPKGKGYICFSIDWSKTTEAIEYKISAAFCSPLDGFIKRLARQIATGRHEFSQKCVGGNIKPLAESPYISNDEFKAMLPKIIQDLDNSPKWAVKGIQNGEFKLGLKQLSPLYKATA